MSVKSDSPLRDQPSLPGWMRRYESSGAQQILEVYNSAFAQAQRLAVMPAVFGPKAWKWQCGGNEFHLSALRYAFRRRLDEINLETSGWADPVFSPTTVSFMHRCPISSCRHRFFGTPCGRSALCPFCFMRDRVQEAYRALEDTFYREREIDLGDVSPRASGGYVRPHTEDWDSWRILCGRETFFVSGQEPIQDVIEAMYTRSDALRSSRGFVRNKIRGRATLATVEPTTEGNWRVTYGHAVITAVNDRRSLVDMIRMTGCDKFKEWVYEAPVGHWKLRSAAAHFVRYPGGMLTGPVHQAIAILTIPADRRRLYRSLGSMFTFRKRQVRDMERRAPALTRKIEVEKTRLERQEELKHSEGTDVSVDCGHAPGPEDLVQETD